MGLREELLALEGRIMLFTTWPGMDEGGDHVGRIRSVGDAYVIIDILESDDHGNATCVRTWHLRISSPLFDAITDADDDDRSEFEVVAAQARPSETP